VFWELDVRNGRLVAGQVGWLEKDARGDGSSYSWEAESSKLLLASGHRFEMLEGASFLCNLGFSLHRT